MTGAVFVMLFAITAPTSVASAPLELRCSGTDTSVGRIRARPSMPFSLVLHLDEGGGRWCRDSCRRRYDLRRGADGGYVLKSLKVGALSEELALSSDRQVLWGRLGESEPKGFTGTLSRAFCKLVGQKP